MTRYQGLPGPGLGQQDDRTPDALDEYLTARKAKLLGQSHRLALAVFEQDLATHLPQDESHIASGDFAAQRVGCFN